mgnify:CR=1 FL=1
MSETRKNLFTRIADAFRTPQVEERKLPNWLTTSPFASVIPRTGIQQGQDTLQLSAVYACVSRIADTICSMEVGVESMGADGSRVPLQDHRHTALLGRSPNPLMGAYEFWQMCISDALLYGTGHAVIMPDKSEMYWVPATDISYTVDTDSGKRFYSYTGSPGPVPQEQILEIKAFRGLSPTYTQLQNLKTAKSIQDFAQTFFDNGGMMGGILSTKEHLNIDQMREAQARWEQEYMGSGNAHKVAILGGGFNYQPIAVPLDQLQYIQVKKFSSEEIARIFQVPPAMIGLEGNTAYSNYEQQVLQFFQGCVLPWVRRIELEVERKLLNEEQNLQCRFNVDGLLRADSASRSEFYRTLLASGVFSINEVRAKEGLSPVDGGDNHHIQINQIPLSSMNDYAANITDTTNG